MNALRPITDQWWRHAMNGACFELAGLYAYFAKLLK
jgi:hypothetical protein